jgi:hypothetical protein
MAIPKTPVSYKDFAKNPLTAMLFMAISGLSYFVYENKTEVAITEYAWVLDLPEAEYIPPPAPPFPPTN